MLATPGFTASLLSQNPSKAGIYNLYLVHAAALKYNGTHRRRKLKATIKISHSQEYSAAHY